MKTRTASRRDWTLRNSRQVNPAMDRSWQDQGGRINWISNSNKSFESAFCAASALWRIVRQSCCQQNFFGKILFKFLQVSWTNCFDKAFQQNWILKILTCIALTCTRGSGRTWQLVDRFEAIEVIRRWPRTLSSTQYGRSIRLVTFRDRSRAEAFKILLKIAEFEIEHLKIEISFNFGIQLFRVIRNWSIELRDWREESEDAQIWRRPGAQADYF